MVNSTIIWTLVARILEETPIKNTLASGGAGYFAEQLSTYFSTLLYFTICNVSLINIEGSCLSSYSPPDKK